MPHSAADSSSSSTNFSRNSIPRLPKANETPAKSCSTTSTKKSLRRSAFKARGLLDRFNDRLWLLTRYLLAPFAEFDAKGYSFHLTSNPFPGETIHPGPYRLGKNVEDANTYRVGHPLAQRVLAQGMALSPPTAEVTFDYSGSGKNIAVLAPLVGTSGWLSCSLLNVNALETEETLILVGTTDAGRPLDDIHCRRLFDVSGAEGTALAEPAAIEAA